MLFSRIASSYKFFRGVVNVYKIKSLVSRRSIANTVDLFQHVKIQMHFICEFCFFCSQFSTSADSESQEEIIRQCFFRPYGKLKCASRSQSNVSSYFFDRCRRVATHPTWVRLCKPSHIALLSASSTRYSHGETSFRQVFCAFKSLFFETYVDGSCIAHKQADIGKFMILMIECLVSIQEVTLFKKTKGVCKCISKRCASQYAICTDQHTLRA